MNSKNIIIPCTRIILEKTFIQGNVKLTRAYIRRKRIAQTVAKNASHGTEKIISETAWRSITGAVYSARYHSQCWFISCSLHSTCETCYGRQLGRASRILKRVRTAPRITICGIRKLRTTCALPSKQKHNVGYLDLSNSTYSMA